jgi:hypothetical protein
LLIRKGKTAILLALLIVLGAPLLPAQDEAGEPVAIYSRGQVSLSLNAGMFIPLFIQSFSGDYTKSNLHLGAVGSLQLGVHLDNNWLLGAEVSGMFAKDIRDNLLIMLPITFKGAYYFHFFPFEIPVYLGAGMTLMKLAEQRQIDFILKPGFSSYWKYSSAWAFGMNFVYWLDFQAWKEDPDKARMGNFLEISLSAKYNF